MQKEPMMESCKFHNDPTNLFFRWLREGGQHYADYLLTGTRRRVGELVAGKLRVAEYDDWYESGMSDEDIAFAARKILEVSLAKFVRDRVTHLEGLAVEDIECLLTSLLVSGLSQIDCDAVAGELLAACEQDGKWPSFRATDGSPRKKTQTGSAQPEPEDGEKGTAGDRRPTPKKSEDRDE
jgi:hypothetical protein